MKYELDTLPVWEAYEAGGECPLCYLHRKLDKQNVDFFLGGSVMQPVIRSLINQYGFCKEHFSKLYKEGQKLSVAILAQSHFMSLQEQQPRHQKAVLATLPARALAPEKSRAFQKALGSYMTELKTRAGQCALCLKSLRSLKRYAYTIVYLRKKKPEFREIYEKSRGFCYTHLPLILEMSGKVLSGRNCRQFLEDLFDRQTSNARRMEEEIDWFIRKYDYRNKDLSWKSSQDALLRLLQRLLGVYPE